MNKRLLITLIAGGFLALLPAPVLAANSQLSQTIEPVICTGTRTDNGQQSLIDNTCNEALLPIITQVQISDRMFVISGKLEYSLLKFFRIYIFGGYFTYDTSPYLKIDGDEWELDLSSYRPMMIAGSYDIAIEYQADDNHMYRQYIEDYIVVPEIKTIAYPDVKPPLPQPDGRLLLSRENPTRPRIIIGRGPIGLIDDRSNNLTGRASIAPNDANLEGELPMLMDGYAAINQAKSMTATGLGLIALLIIVVGGCFVWLKLRRQSASNN